MKTKRFLSFLSYLCFLFLGQLPLHGSWLERKAEGWAWYEDVAQKEGEQAKQDIPKEVVASVTLSSSAAEEAAKIRKDLEEKLAQAVLYPTEENVALYMQEQQKWIHQAAEFSGMWAKVLLQQPQLDATVTDFPVSQYGIQLQKQMQQERRHQLMQQLIQSYGLFFFYEGQHKVSQAFALVVQEFAQKYGWEVRAISKDGVLIEGFVHNHIDNGSIHQLGIELFPSLFLVNPKTAAITPVAFGLASVDRIEANIELQFNQWVEENP
jgi:conjugal transfer pilus assembly protein TraF